MKTLITSACLLLALMGSAWAQCGSCGTSAPGLPYPLVDWRFVNAGTLPQTHHYGMLYDDVEVTIEDGSRLNLTPNEIEIVLRSRVDWRKEITAWSSCTGRGTTIATEGSLRGPVRMRLNRNSCNADTVILRKGEFLVGMVDKYNMDINYFWRMWAGKIITFEWTLDLHFETRMYPPPWSFFFPGIPLNTDPNGGILYDRDGKADIAVWREGPWWANASEWWVINSSTGSTAYKQYGRPSDRPIPYDYDFDGRIDPAIYRPSTGEWWIINSFTGVTRVEQWGTNTDIPAPGDYDGDGKADLAVWRPRTGEWLIKHFTGGERTIQWGVDPEMSVAADYDGDGRTEPAVWNYGTGVWSIFTSPPRTIPWEGRLGSPAQADFDGDGKTDLATWVSSTGMWFIKNSGGNSETKRQWGTWGDFPVPRDYDGDNKADIAVWRPSTGEWFIIKSSDGNVIVRQWGTWGDRPVPAK